MGTRRTHTNDLAILEVSTGTLRGNLAIVHHLLCACKVFDVVEGASLRHGRQRGIICGCNYKAWLLQRPSFLLSTLFSWCCFLDWRFLS